MKRIRTFWICQLILTGLILVLSNSCDKDKETDDVLVTLPALTTSTVTNITENTAYSGGNITSDGGAPVIAKGVCWSIQNYPTITDSSTTNGTGITAFSSVISGLSSNTLYYIRAYATNSKGTAYGNELSFTTEQSSLQKGLVAYYPLNGNTFDKSGNGNNGVNYGVALDYDRFGNLACAYFNGNSSYFEVPDNPSLNFGTEKDFSFCFWIKPEYELSWNSLISKGTEDSPIYQLALWDGHVLFESGSRTDYFLSTAILPLNEWHFCVVIVERSANRVKFYIDSYLDNSISDNSLKNYNFSSEATLKFGVERLFMSGFYYLGNLDDIRIYNRALNNQDIEALYKE